MPKKIIHWFRQDLRLSDNPALFEAAKNGVVYPIFILDDVHAGNFQPGGASRVWLHHALENLNKQLDGNLTVYSGDPLEIIPALASANHIDAVYWNRCYEPWQIARDSKLKALLTQEGIAVFSFKASVLWEPWTIAKQDGSPYRVFTPYYKNGCLAAEPPGESLPEPAKIKWHHFVDAESDIDALRLLPKIRWDGGMVEHWNISEQGAHERLDKFIHGGINAYKEGRNFPAQTKVSRLSPYLHWGQISPRQAWHAACEAGDNANIDCFLSELGWREFSCYLLYHFPDLPEKNMQSKFDDFPWEEDRDLLKKWQQGMTGIPIVDAGMRELWQTGYMHNRARMITASFLVKNLLQHWHHGEAWFWDCLVDADLANNSASWQWVAGCGADAAPYFRIFNPVTQAKKFDPDGDYVRRYIPELARLSNTYLFNPWEAPADVLEKAGVTLGSTYPKPIVDLKVSRQRALDAFASIKISASLGEQ